MTPPGEDCAERAAQEFADAIVELVGADGEVAVQIPDAEFDRIVGVSPRVANAVAFDVMIFGAKQVVVWARRPALGWWTFDDGTVTADAWAVIEQIVDRGGQVLRERRGNPFRNGIVQLLERDGTLVCSMDDGGAGPRNRLTTFPPYRHAV